MATDSGLPGRSRVHADDQRSELVGYRGAVDRAVGELDGLARKAGGWGLPGVERAAMAARDAMHSLSRAIADVTSEDDTDEG